MHLNNYLVEWRSSHDKNSDNTYVYHELSYTFDASNPFEFVDAFGDSGNDASLPGRPTNIEQKIRKDGYHSQNIISNRMNTKTKLS